MGLCWDCFGTVLGLCWDCFGTVWGLFGDCFGTVLEMFWDCFGIVLELFWDCFGTVLDLFWYCFGNVLGIFKRCIWGVVGLSPAEKVKVKGIVFRVPARKQESALPQLYQILAPGGRGGSPIRKTTRHEICPRIKGLKSIYT